MDVLELALRAFGAQQDYIEQIRKELELLGVEVESYGPVQLYTGVNVLGKGQNSVVLRGKLLGEFTCTCKILRPDASRESLLHEARALLHANSVGVGPKRYTFTKHVLVYEYIDGEPLEKWIWRGDVDSDKIRRVVSEALRQAYRLDKIALLHDELSRPREHILVTQDLKVYIIDFETSTLGSKSGKKNLTQLVNAFFLGGSDITRRIREVLGLTQDKLAKIAELVREYKREPREEVVESIIKVLES